MNIEKKIDKFEKRYDKAQPGETVKVIKFKRKHFNDELSTSFGFGYQDLKEEGKAFLKYLITTDVDVKMVPTNSDPENFELLVTTEKLPF